MDRLEQSIFIAALFFVFVGAMTWLIV